MQSQMLNREEMFKAIASKLPHEINHEIEGHLYGIGVCKTECDRLLEWFNNNNELRCCGTEVEELTNFLLESEEAIGYLCKQNEIFEKYYKIHFVENEKPFILMSKTCSLIASVLMHMWH